jgi:Ca2+-binding RTX toxin-like protein
VSTRSTVASERDTLYGDPDNDALAGGLGTDSCDGGTGSDAQTSCETRVSIP